MGFELNKLGSLLVGGSLLVVPTLNGCSNAGMDDPPLMQQADPVQTQPPPPVNAAPQTPSPTPASNVTPQAPDSQVGVGTGNPAPVPGTNTGDVPVTPPAPNPGMAGTGNMDGIAGMGGAMPPVMGPEPPTGTGEPTTNPPVDPPAMAVDLGVGDGSDVIAIGDSWMNLDNRIGIQQSLLKASGQPYRTYGVPGTRLLDGVIPGQYEAAKRENPDIKTVVMTGGGNDILQDLLVLPTCLTEPLGDACKMRVDEVGARYQELFEEMDADGVKDVLIIQYGRGTFAGAGSVDYGWEATAPNCVMPPADLTIRCHMLDPDELVSSGYLPIGGDGIHPTEMSYDIIGEGAYQLMEDEGMRR